MARYQCGICGYIFDEEKEGKLFSELEKCPVCGHSPDNLRLLEEQPAAVPEKMCIRDSVSASYDISSKEYLKPLLQYLKEN